MKWYKPIIAVALLSLLVGCRSQVVGPVKHDSDGNTYRTVEHKLELKTTADVACTGTCLRP